MRNRGFRICKEEEQGWLETMGILLASSQHQIENRLPHGSPGQELESEFWEMIEGWEWSGMSQQKRDGEGCVLLYKEVGLSVS
jgi:hypothetical protein